MNVARMGHSATVLPSGLVLVAGGLPKLAWTGDGGTIDGLSSAELYDPAHGTWSETGPMGTPRHDPYGFVIRGGVHAGEVLKVGGCSALFETGDPWVYCRALPTTEFYVSATGAWEPGPQMLYASVDVIQLADGKLLSVGNLDVPNRPGPETQLLDPSAAEATWRLVSPMGSPRVATSLVLLASGEVLVVGGIARFTSNGALSSDVERYDPMNDRWRTAASLPDPRGGAVLIRLPSGKVLLAGGCGNAMSDCSFPGVPPTSNAWIYEPEQDVWRQTTPTNYPHLSAKGIVLDSGRVLIAGGSFKRAGDAGIDYYPSSSEEIFDPESETWSLTGPMPHYVMGGGAMVKLASGAVLFTGGSVNGKLPEEEFVAIPAAQLFR